MTLWSRLHELLGTDEVNGADTKRIWFEMLLSLFVKPQLKQLPIRLKRVLLHLVWLFFL
jgi:hypothetical protein